MCTEFASLCTEFASLCTEFEPADCIGGGPRPWSAKASNRSPVSVSGAPSSRRWIDSNGKQVSKLATKTRKKAQMTALGYRVHGKFTKHKFARLTPIGLAQCMIRMGQAIKERYERDSSPAKGGAGQ